MMQPVYGSLDCDTRGQSLEPVVNALMDPASNHLISPPIVQRSSSWCKHVDPETHLCLLDVMNIKLLDIDIFSAEWSDVKSGHMQQRLPESDEPIIFNTYIVSRKVCIVHIALVNWCIYFSHFQIFFENIYFRVDGSLKKNVTLNCK